MLALGVLLPAAAQATTYTFDHGAGTSDWSNSLNWSPDGVPGTGDDAIIPDPHTVTLSSGAASIHSLTLGPGNLAGLIIDGPATSLTLGTGSSSFHSSLGLQNGATLTLGTSTMWDGGVVGFCTGGNCTVNIPPASTLDIQGNVIAGNGGYWHNLGTVTRSSGADTVDLRGAFENDGLVQVQTGRVQIGGDGATHQTDGAYTVASGAVFDVAGDTDFASGSSVSGAGRVHFSYQTAHFLPGSSLTPARIDMKGGTLDNSIDVSVPDFIADGGTRMGSGAFTVTSTAAFLLSNLQIRGTGMNLEGTTTITNGFLLDAGATVNLGPSTTWTGGIITGCLNGPGSCTIVIGPGEVLDIQGNLSANDGSGTTVWQNQGTITRSTGTGILKYDATLANAGTVDLQTGTLQAAHYSQTAGTTRLGSATTFSGNLPLQGGSLTGAGTVTGAVTNSGGTVTPGGSPGHLTINGSYTQGPGGRFAAEIGGTAQGADYDWLSVTGNVSLAGELAITTASGYVPGVADAFDVITSGGTVTGAFDSLSGDRLADRRYYTTYTPGAARLTVQIAAVNTAPPSVSGSAAVGQSLGCDPGGWSGPVTFAYAWLRDGTAIDGATGATYDVVDADAGHTLVCRVTASDANGSNTVDSAGFAIPPPVPRPAPAAPGLPPECSLPPQPASPQPVLYRFVVIRPLRSGVTYQLPGCPVEVTLDRALLIPVNTVVDATTGRIVLTSARVRSGTQSITLYAGAFQVRQRLGERGITEFGLAGKGLPLAGKARVAQKKRKKPDLKAVRKLWADGDGQFRTRGGYATATIRGTKWLTIDRFNTTLIQVARGSVLVRDLLRNADVVVRAGETYEARATSTYLNRVRTNPRYGKRYSILTTRDGVFHIYRNGRRVKVS